jgi:CheY-like chemotaxis protein
MVDDGKKALRALTEGDYDAIVMDIAMPEMNGFEAIAEIRKLPGAKGKIPILVVSAHAYA